MNVCMCVHTCVCVCAHACLCVRVCVGLLMGMLQFNSQFAVVVSSTAVDHVTIYHVSISIAEWLLDPFLSHCALTEVLQLVQAHFHPGACFVVH